MVNTRKASNVYKSRRKSGYSKANALRYARRYDPDFSIKKGEARIKQDRQRKADFNRGNYVEAEQETETKTTSQTTPLTSKNQEVIYKDDKPIFVASPEASAKIQKEYSKHQQEKSKGTDLIQYFKQQSYLRQLQSLQVDKIMYKPSDPHLTTSTKAATTPGPHKELIQSKKDRLITKVKVGYRSINQKARDVVENNPLTKATIAAGFTPKRVSESTGVVMASLVPARITGQKYKQDIKSFYSGAMAGAISSFRKEPLKGAVSFGSMFVGVGVLGVTGKIIGFGAKAAKASKIVKGVSNLIPKSMKYYGSKITDKLIGGTIKYGLPISYIGSVGVKVALEPTIRQKGAKLGEMVVSEAVPMTGGAYSAVKTLPKISGFLRTIKRKEVPIESIVPAQVLMGRSRFPTAGKNLSPLKRAQLHKSMFENNRYSLPHTKGSHGYHATTANRITDITDPLHISGKGVSVHFLEQSNKVSLYGTNIFPELNAPKVFAIRISRYEINVGKEISRKPSVYQWSRPTQPNVAYIPGTKTEVEAVLISGSRISTVGKRYYFKYKGIRVPIDEAVTAKPFGNLKDYKRLNKALKQTNGLSTSSTYTTRSIFNPSTIGLSAYISYKSSKSSIMSSSKPIISKPTRSLKSSIMSSSKPISKITSIVGNPIITPSPPPPPPPTLKSFDTPRKRKKRDKKLSRELKYMPSLKGFQTNLKRTGSADITGLKVRGI